jgi:hypothetical protein
VVTGLVLDEPVEADPPELVEPALEAAVEPLAEVVTVVWLALEPAVLCLASTGSWPETSWTKITPHASAKVVPAAANVCLRIRMIRSRRARNRSVTVGRASGADAIAVSLLLGD